jgi:hypothetical protein
MRARCQEVFTSVKWKLFQWLIPPDDLCRSRKWYSFDRGDTLNSVKADFVHLLLRFPPVILLLSLFVGSVQGQETGTLRGVISDSLNGEAVIYANVILQGTTIGAATNTLGYYFLTSVPVGEFQVTISCLGYRTFRSAVVVRRGEVTRLDARLVPVDVQNEGLTVVGELDARRNASDLGLQKITTRELRMVPSGVEADVFRIIQALPGVSSVGDVTSRFYVRGGGGDQNAILFNGATIYNPFHGLGMMSAIDPEMISVMEFYKGGFGAEYGGRISSIINVVTKDGDKNTFGGSGYASLVSGKVMVEGPIPDGSFIVTGRKSYYGKYLNRFMHNQDAPFDFYDVSMKVTSTSPLLGKDSKVSLFAFFSKDEVVRDDPFKSDYAVSNNVYGINWYKVWSSPLYSVVSLSYSGLDAELKPNQSGSTPKANTVSDISANWDFTYMYESRDELAFGVQTKSLQTSLSLRNIRGSWVDLLERGFDFTLYGDYRFLRFESISFTLGMRFKLGALSWGRPVPFEPRTSITYKPLPNVAFKAAFGIYSQELTTLTDETEIISVFEPWAITPDKINSPHAFHYQAGLKYYFTESSTAELEGYYRTFVDLIDVNDKKTLPRDNDYMNVDGKSYGVEVLLKRQEMDFFIQGSYCLSWAYTIKRGIVTTPKFDSRHSINLLAEYTFGSGWSSSTMWALKSGLPFTPIAGFYDRLESSTDVLGRYTGAIYWGEKNSRRLPYYHRLDINLTKQFQLGWAKMTVGANVINVYDRRNIFYFDKNTGEQVFMLRFFPSLSIKVDW